MTQTLLFVGHRVGALREALAMGHEAVALVDQPPPRALRPLYRAVHEVETLSLSGEALLEAAARALDGARPAAVVALTERGVVAAATLRDHFGLGGLSPDAARRCHDKVVMKEAFRQAGVPCADWVALDAPDDCEPARLVAALGLPLVAKDRDSSGSRGTVVCRQLDELPAHARPGRMAERFVHGAEMSIEAFVCDGEVLMDNLTEYLRPGWSNLLPARVEPAFACTLRDFNRRVLSALGVTRGITHLEVFLTHNGIVAGELAARPPGGHLMELLALAHDFNPWRALLTLELGLRPSLPDPADARPVGMWILHPGEGLCERVEGLEEARAMPGILEVRCAARPNKPIPPRLGVGQETGVILATADSPDAVAERLARAHDAITIHVRAPE